MVTEAEKDKRLAEALRNPGLVEILDPPYAVAVERAGERGGVKTCLASSAPLRGM